MRNVFNSVRKSKVKYSNFNLTHERIFSCGLGNLVPILCQEVVAGDTFKDTTELLIRFAPLLAPVMHRIDVYTHFFFVPNRLLWDDWEDFITGGEDGEDDLMPPMYAVTADQAKQAGLFTPGNLPDYLGVPAPSDTTGNAPFTFSALPFRAYLKIYNDYYRDQNLEDERPINTRTGGLIQPDFVEGSGNFFPDIVNLKHRAWTKDYFSSALPFAQRGNDVSVPLDSVVSFKPGTSPRYVQVNGAPFPDNPTNPKDKVLKSVGTNSSGRIIAEIGNASDPVGSPNSVYTQANLDVSKSLQVKSTNITVRTLRRLFAIQRFEENNATGGSRYIEQLLARFGVVSDDARLQRAEYLGGGKQPVVISETLQTSQTTTGENGSPQGNQTGQGLSAGRTNQFKRRFKEHGWLIGIMSIVPKPVYMQGLPKQFSRLTRYDYLTPEFAGIGEQEVKVNELYLTNTSDGDKTFGYQGRYNEYRYIPSSVHGAFRDTLSFWHLARKFANVPKLNSSFVHMTPEDFERIFAVYSKEQTYVQLINHLTARRALPKYPYND